MKVESDKRNFEVTENEMKGFLSHKKQVYDRFVDLIPELAAAIQPHVLVIRPHPSEDRSIWDERAKHIANVEVVLEGGVAPWIMGSSMLIHNNCTTAVEAADVLVGSNGMAVVGQSRECRARS